MLEIFRFILLSLSAVKAAPFFLRSGRDAVWDRRTASPSTVLSYNGWTSVGCFVDSVDDRQLEHPEATVGGTQGMTVERCLDACYASGYSFAGLEYSQECYCGNILPSTPATDGRCDMVCNGNSLEYCGGENGLGIYQYGTVSPCGPTTLQSYDGYTFLNCYADSRSARVLPEQMFLQGPMTVETCISSCNGAGYEFSGVEYGQECYCGRTAPTTVATDGRCDMVCQGDLGEYCGGQDAVAVYQSNSPSNMPHNVQSYNGWSYSGCFVDSVDSRVLPQRTDTQQDSVMTVEICIDACASQGYMYAGLEYQQECYCGTSLPPVMATDGRCSMVCIGNPLEYCGGSDGLSIYIHQPGALTTTTSRTSVPPPTTTGTSSNCPVSTTSTTIQTLPPPPTTTTSHGPSDTTYTTTYTLTTTAGQPITLATTIVAPVTATTTFVGPLVYTTTIPETITGSTTVAGTVTGSTTIDITLTKTTTIAGPYTFSTAIVAEETVTTTVVGEETYTTTIPVPITETISVPVTETESTLVPVTITQTTTIAEPFTRTTTVDVVETGDTTIFEPTLITIDVVETIPLTNSVETALTVHTTDFIPIVVGTTIAKTTTVNEVEFPVTFFTITTSSFVEIPTTFFVDGETFTGFEGFFSLIFPEEFAETRVTVPVPTTIFDVEVTTSTFTDVGIFVTETLVPEPTTFTTTVFEPVPTTNFDIEPVSSTSFEVEAFTSTTFDYATITTTSFSLETYTTTIYVPETTTFTSLDVEVVTTPTFGVETLTTVTIVEESRTTTTFEIVEYTTTSSAVRPVTTTTFGVDEYTTRSFDIETATTTTYGEGVVTVSTTSVEHITTSTDTIYPYTTVTTIITTALPATASAP